MLVTCQDLKERKFVKPKILPFCELLLPAICSLRLSQHHPHAWYRLACSEQGQAKTVLICKYTFETGFECIHSKLDLNVFSCNQLRLSFHYHFLQVYMMINLEYDPP
jgi:hypothetical protein